MRSLMRVVWLSAVTTATVPARAQTFMTPAQCKGIVAYRDGVGRQAKVAAERYDVFNGQKALLQSALDQANSDLAWNGGTAGDLKRAAFVVQKLCEATSHTIAGLTPEGAVIGTIEEAAGDVKDVTVRLIAAANAAKGVGDKVQLTIHGDNAVDAAMRDAALELVKSLAKEKRLKNLGPVARSVAELWQAQAAVQEALTAGKLETEQRDFEAVAKQGIGELTAAISGYEASSKIELETINAIDEIHRTIDVEVLSSCSTKLCDDAEKAAKSLHDETIAKTDYSWAEAQALRRDGPDYSQADAELSRIQKEFHCATNRKNFERRRSR